MPGKLPAPPPPLLFLLSEFWAQFPWQGNDEKMGDTLTPGNTKVKPSPPPPPLTPKDSSIIQRRLSTGLSFVKDGD